MQQRRPSPAAAALLCLAAALAGFGGARAATLEEVQKRGYLSCGLAGETPIFGRQNDMGAWSGFDVDFCRALAAAIFDDAGKAQFTALPAKERSRALQQGLVDLLAGGSGWTLSREASQKLLFVAVSLYDGQGFLARRDKIAILVKARAGVKICVQQGTSQELELATYFHARNIGYEPRLYDTLEDAARGYEQGHCDALTGTLSELYAARSLFSAPEAYAVLPELLSKAQHGPIVRHGDDAWFSIVRWTLFAMLDAEELGVSSANVDAALRSENPDIRRLLGVEGNPGEALGFSGDWAYRIVKHIGNYGELFDHDLGRDSPFGMERRLNALWSKGGLMCAPPVR